MIEFLLVGGLAFTMFLGVFLMLLLATRRHHGDGAENTARRAEVVFARVEADAEARRRAALRER
jgi:hypothetical protein